MKKRKILSADTVRFLIDNGYTENVYLFSK